LKPLITAIPIAGPIITALNVSTEALNGIVDKCLVPVVDGLNTVAPPINNILDIGLGVGCEGKRLLTEAQKALQEAQAAASVITGGGLKKQQQQKQRQAQLFKNLDFHRAIIRQHTDKTRRRIAATCRTAYGKTTTRRHAITI
jgi:hypothetical protein